MRKLLLFVIAVAVSSLAIAQSDCDGFIAQPNCDTRLDDEVCLFNKIVAHFGDKDSISYTFGQSGVEYFYQGEKLSVKSIARGIFWSADFIVMLKLQMSHHKSSTLILMKLLVLLQQR